MLSDNLRDGRNSITFYMEKEFTLETDQRPLVLHI